MSEVIGFLPGKEKNKGKTNKKAGNSNKGKVAPAQPADDKKGDETEGSNNPDEDQEE